MSIVYLKEKNSKKIVLLKLFEMQDNFPLQRGRGDQGNSCIFLIEWTEGNPQ